MMPDVSKGKNPSCFCVPSPHIYTDVEAPLTACVSLDSCRLDAAIARLPPKCCHRVSTDEEAFDKRFVERIIEKLSSMAAGSCRTARERQAEGDSGGSPRRWWRVVSMVSICSFLGTPPKLASQEPIGKTYLRNILVLNHYI